jgi:anti-sigma factor RsiW
MTDMDDGIALWRRYRQGLSSPPAPDELTLAAYAEGRLDEDKAAPVESWLAQNLGRLDDLAAARAAAEAATVVLGRKAEIRAARGLVYESVQRLGARVLLLRGAAWGSVAAGFLVACLIGYEAGVATRGHTLAALSTAAHEISFVASAEVPLSTAMGVGDDAGEEL